MSKAQGNRNKRLLSRIVYLSGLALWLGLSLTQTSALAKDTDFQKGKNWNDGEQNYRSDKGAEKNLTQLTKRISVKQFDGNPKLKLAFYDDNSLTIKTEFDSFQGRISTSGKRKYRQPGSMPFAEIKSTDNGFKIRTVDGQMLWKIKLYPTKIKISDNKDNRDAFEIKFPTNDMTAKLVKEDQLLGKSRYYPDSGKIKLKNANGDKLTSIATSQFSSAYLVLLLQQIPETERYIILAELIARDW